MKNSKLILKLSLVMIVLGIIIYYVGLLMGGKANNINNKFISIGSSDSERIIQSEELGEFSNISIDVVLDSVELVKSNENKIELNYNESLSEAKYEIKDSTLIVKQPKKNTVGLHFNMTGFNSENLNYMKIYVKDTSTLKNIIINASDSDIIVDSLNNNTINIDCNYGDVDINNLSSDNVKVTMADGDLNFNNVVSSTILNIENDYGDVNISDSDFNDFIAVLKDGSLNMSNSIANNSDIKNKYGNITSTNFLSNGIIVHSNDGNIDLDGSFFNNTSLNNDYGNVSFRSSEDENLYNYFITNKYGNINIGSNKFEGSFTKDNNASNTLSVNCKDGNVKLNFKN